MLITRNNFSNVIRSFDLFSSNESVLVAVSGGLDSVALCHLLALTNQKFSIAHVNYGLRGDESDSDEKFVVALAEKLGVECFVHHANRDENVELKKGIQEWARDARYKWFQQLNIEHNIKYVLTAHHQGDQSETILHQFFRGGTLAALRGMKMIQGDVLRPLLNFSREEIMRFAIENNLKWREDSSNAKSDYTRNLLRNEIIPVLKKVNPRLEESLAKRASIFSEAESLVTKFIHQIIEEQKIIRNDGIFITIDWLLQFEYKQLLMWQLMEPTGFSSFQVDDALNLLSSQKGKRIDSQSHQLWKQESELVIRKRNSDELDLVIIDTLPANVFLRKTIGLSRRVLSEVHFAKDQSEVFLDYAKLSFPLIIRTWKAGDVFTPLGMSGKQKVSDFLIQSKVASYDKQHILVLESNGEIAAILGHRISNDFRITDISSSALGIVIEDNL